MPRKPTPDDVKARAIAAARNGLKTRAIADQLGVSHVSVARWLKEAPAVAPAPPLKAAPAPEAPPPAEAEAAAPAAGMAGALADLRGLLTELRGALRLAKDAGHHAAAASAMGSMARLMPVLARLEKTQAEEKDAMRVSLADIEQAGREVDALFDAYDSRPLHCADCGRKLSISWASEGDT